MTATYSTNQQVVQRCPLVLSALASINAGLTAGSYTVITLDTLRVEAQRQILVALERRDPPITSGSISRPTDLQEAEIALTIALACEGVQQRVSVARGAMQPETYSQQAEYWRVQYEREITAARPVDGVKGIGNTFSWGRG